MYRDEKCINKLYMINEDNKFYGWKCDQCGLRIDEVDKVNF